MTAEEFFRKKIKEKCPHQEVVTLANSLITAEDGIRWAYEFSQLPSVLYISQQEISDEEIEKEGNRFVFNENGYFFKQGAKWYREQLKQIK